MSLIDQQYITDHRLGDVIQYLAYALAQHRPVDHAAFARRWLANLETAMQANGSASAAGINLLGISGTRLAPKPKPTFVLPTSGSDAGSGSTSTPAARDGGPSNVRAPPAVSPSSAAGGGAHRGAAMRRRNHGARALVALIDRLPESAHPEAFKLLEALVASQAATPNNGSTVASRTASSRDLPGGTGTQAPDNRPPPRAVHFSPAVTGEAAPRADGGGEGAVGGSALAAGDGGGGGGGGGARRSSKRRIGVSATPLSVARVTDYVPPCVEKNPAEMAKLVACIESSTLFAAFDDDQRVTVALAMVKRAFGVAEVILQEGAPGLDTMFLIMDGTVEIQRDGKVVATLDAGQYFGELELMYNVPACAATVKTVTAVETYALSKDTYQNLVLHSTLARREVFLAQIDKVDFLRGMPDYDRMTLAEALSTAKYEPGDNIIRCEEQSQWMYIIMEGTVRVVGREDGRKVDVIDLGAGEVVGELEFLFSHRAIADVVALTIVKVAKLNRKHFEMCMGAISDNLKRYVNSDKYAHYLTQSAPETVKQEIAQVARHASARHIDVAGEVDVKGPAFATEGELVFGGPGTIFRFPLLATQHDGLVVIGLQEDGTVLFWNPVMTRVTAYEPTAAVGRSVYSFIRNNDDQKALYSMAQAARKWAGNWEGFQAAGCYKRAQVAFSHANGLSRAFLNVTVLPPIIAQPKSKSEVLIMIGHAAKRAQSQQNDTIDVGEWLLSELKPRVDAIRESCLQLADGGNVGEAVTELQTVVAKFAPVARTNMSDLMENWQAVGIRTLMQKLVTELVQETKIMGNKFTVDVADSVPDADVYLDTIKLPALLAGRVRKANRLFNNVSINVSVFVADPPVASGGAGGAAVSGGRRFVTFRVVDTGPGISAEVVESINSSSVANAANSNSVCKIGGGLRKMKTELGKIGGTMELASGTWGTTVTATFPLCVASSSTEGEAGACAPGQTCTAVMVETDAIQRNAMCSYLWRRRHAVLPAATWREVQQHIKAGNCDILIVDPDCIAEDMTRSGIYTNPLEMLKEYSTKMAVVITSETFDEQETPLDEQQERFGGYLMLAKPCSAARLHDVMERAEKIVMRLREERERIAQLRETFSKTKRGAWKKGRMLGKGAFGEVYEAIDVLTGGKMAMKQLRITEANKGIVSELANEIDTMTTLQHENIIHYFYCEQPNDLQMNIFMELAMGGTLNDRIKAEPEGMSLPILVSSLRDILSGCAYIHSHNFVHCDLKPANVLLDSNGVGKLGDFGTAKQLAPGEKIMAMRGTPAYMAPEVMNADETEGIGFGMKADIWSLGCIVLEMATGRPPFFHIQGTGGPMGLIRYISELTECPDLSPLFQKPPAVFEFVKACLDPDPDSRPTARELLNYSLMLESGNSGAAAQKLLARAQLLHVLNKFVAFQDVDEGGAGGGGEGGDVRDAFISKLRGADSFFDSDEEEEEDEGDDEGSDDSNEANGENNANGDPGEATAAKTRAAVGRGGGSDDDDAEGDTITTTNANNASNRKITDGALAPSSSNSRFAGGGGPSANSGAAARLSGRGSLLNGGPLKQGSARARRLRAVSADSGSGSDMGGRSSTPGSSPSGHILLARHSNVWAAPTMRSVSPDTGGESDEG